jgi:hypothetical protein
MQLGVLAGSRHNSSVYWWPDAPAAQQAESHDHHAAAAGHPAFFGLNTFIEPYWIRHLHASRGLAGVALTCFLAGGVAGTLLGGRIADRVGAVRTVQIGTAVILPALAGLLLAPGRCSPCWPCPRSPCCAARCCATLPNPPR